LLYKYIYLFYF